MMIDDDGCISSMSQAAKAAVSEGQLPFQVTEQAEKASAT